MIRRPPRSTQSRSSAASDVYKRRERHRPRGHPAELAVGSAQAILALIDAARGRSVPPRGRHPIAVVGVHDLQPSFAEHLLRGLPREGRPVTDGAVDGAVEPGDPGHLVRLVHQGAQAQLAALHLALGPASLADVAAETEDATHDATVLDERLELPGDGELAVAWKFEALIEDGGVVRGVFGLGRDVSERRRAEREMERSELRLRTLVNETNQMTWVTGLDGAIDSPAGDWMAFTGQSAEEMLGEGWLQVVHLSLIHI